MVSPKRLAVLAMALFSVHAFAGSELDSEISDLQVQLVNKQTHRAVKPRAKSAPLGKKNAGTTELPHPDKFSDRRIKHDKEPPVLAATAQQAYDPRPMGPAPGSLAKAELSDETAAEAAADAASKDAISNETPVAPPQAPTLPNLSPEERAALDTPSTPSTPKNVIDVGSPKTLKKSNKVTVAPLLSIKPVAKPIAPEYKPEPATIPATRETYVAANKSATTVSTRAPKTKSSAEANASGIIQRVTLLPVASVSTFDGEDMSRVIPSGVSNPMAVAPAGSLLTDLNLGLGSVMFETGVNFIQTGAQTGYAPYSGYGDYSMNELVTLSYVGIPIEAKYLFSGERPSGFYVKGGVNPVYLMSHKYEPYAGYNNEFRLGGYGSFDVLLTAGLGYALKIGEHYQLVLDVQGYQGVIPVFQMYNVFNVGGTAGIGISYVL